MAALNEMPNAEPLPRSTSASVVVNGCYLPPPEDKDGKVWVRTATLIQADPHVLYALWRDLDSVPLWQEQVVSVVTTGPTTSRWTMRLGDDDADKTTSWDSEILAEEPGKRIAWRSIQGEPQNAGEVIFEPAPAGRGTYVTLLQEFGIGKIASVLGSLVSRNPKQTVIENLRHFKALAETGEIPRSQNAPSGERGFIGQRKRSMYGETITTPPGLN